MHIEKRIKEASKMGFKKIIIPKLNKKISSKKMNIIEIKHISELVTNI
jgi:predicted ATP-dependent serine protease